MLFRHVARYSFIAGAWLPIACATAGEQPSVANGGGQAGSAAGGSGANAGGGGSFGIADSGNPVDGTCATDSAEAVLVQEPVDIIMVLDNSGSMADELAAVETNINVNFASILESSGVDYRVILISRHRKEVRAESGESSTSICVEAPLGGVPLCPSPENPILVPAPVFKPPVFYHYNTKIESADSFDWILTGYHSQDTRTGLAPNGWSAWLRPGAKKVFLELTDDNEDMTVAAFVPQLQALAPAHFGADPQQPSFVFHSIIGIREKTAPTAAYLPDEPIETAICTGNNNPVANAGVTYQELSRLTGGLRFPLCQFSGYDVVFQTIAEDVSQKRQLACDFDIPAPPAGRTLDMDKVAVNYTPGDGSGQVRLGQAATSAACQADAFYIENDRIVLCPQSCATVKADPGASVDVLFTCESTIIR